MRRLAILVLFPLLAGSALAQSGGEPLDAALRRALAEQAAAQAITTACVLLNGVIVGLITTGTFQALIAIINAGVLW